VRLKARVDAVEGLDAGAILPRSPMRMAPQSKSFARSRSDKSRMWAEATKKRRLQMRENASAGRLPQTKAHL
jgi:hypothetical protein